MYNTKSNVIFSMMLAIDVWRNLFTSVVERFQSRQNVYSLQLSCCLFPLVVDDSDSAYVAHST